MKEKVIIEELSISKKGQLNTFQLRVPADAKSIIGFEMNAIGLILNDVPVFGGLPAGLLKFQHSEVIGEIRMQSCGKSNLFYSGEVCFNDLNLGFADFTQTPESISSQWTKGFKREEDVVLVDECCALVQGNYRDIIGTLTNTDLVYTVKVYMWYSTE
jgi:hypothetical protein